MNRPARCCPAVLVRAAGLVPLIAGLVLLVAGPAAPAAAADARGAMAEGFVLFAAGNHEEAARRFEEAAAKAASEGLDPATALYDRGCALLKAGRLAEAVAAFGEASRSPDRDLAARAHYHGGIALATAAAAAETAGPLDRAVALLDQALASYESAMRIEPDDEDPKVNHELAFRKKAQLERRQKEQEKRRGDRGQPPPPAQARAVEQMSGAPRERPKPSGTELRPDEARTMLDAMKQQEISQRSRVRTPRGDSAPVEKPW